MTDYEKTARLHRLLRQRHLGNGTNGDAWSYFTEVRNKTGFGGGRERTADAIAMSLWPSRGLLLHGFEVKVSRTDWLRELRDPSKADAFARYCDRWWLVTEPDVVEDGELPEMWGHLVRRGGKLAQATAAAELEPQDCDRTFLAALLRAAGRSTEAKPEAVREAEQAASQAAEDRWKAEVEREKKRAGDYQAQIQEFVRASGLPLNGRFPKPYTPRELGAAVKLVLQGEAQTEQLEKRLGRVAEQAEHIAESARGLAAEAA